MDLALAWGDAGRTTVVRLARQEFVLSNHPAGRGSSLVQSQHRHRSCGPVQRRALSSLRFSRWPTCRDALRSVLDKGGHLGISAAARCAAHADSSSARAVNGEGGSVPIFRVASRTRTSAHRSHPLGQQPRAHTERADFLVPPRRLSDEPRSRTIAAHQVPRCPRDLLDVEALPARRLRFAFRRSHRRFN